MFKYLLSCYHKWLKIKVFNHLRFSLGLADNNIREREISIDERRNALNLGAYYKGAVGEECPQGKGVHSEAECIEAGLLVDHPFRGSISSSDRPSGCFWDRNGQSYFNDVFQQSQFSFELIDTGGICKHNGINTSH